MNCAPTQIEPQLNFEGDLQEAAQQRDADKVKTAHLAPLLMKAERCGCVSRDTPKQTDFGMIGICHDTVLPAPHHRSLFPARTMILPGACAVKLPPSIVMLAPAAHGQRHFLGRSNV